jgi:hypothetical protein
MPRRRWSKRRVVSSGSVAIPPFYRFAAGGDAKSSMSALVCVIPTRRIGMRDRGKAARNAGSSGRHAITDSTPRIPLIGLDIEAWAGDHEAQIMSTTSAREEAFLDTLDEIRVNDEQLAVSDIRQLESADEITHFFAKLHYNVDKRTNIPDYDVLGMSSEDMRQHIHKTELIGKDPEDGDISIYLLKSGL